MLWPPAQRPAMTPSWRWGYAMTVSTRIHTYGYSSFGPAVGMVSGVANYEQARSLPQPLVLVVDDEPGIVEFLRFALEDNGYRVATAHDGSQALDTIEREHD